MPSCDLHMLKVKARVRYRGSSFEWASVMLLEVTNYVWEKFNL